MQATPFLKHYSYDKCDIVAKILFDLSDEAKNRQITVKTLLKHLKKHLLSLIDRGNVSDIKKMFHCNEFKSVISRLFIKEKNGRKKATNTSQQILDKLFFAACPSNVLEIIANNLGKNHFGLILKKNKFAKLIIFFNIYKAKEDFNMQNKSDKNGFESLLDFLLHLYTSTTHSSYASTLLDDFSEQYFSKSMKDSYAGVKHATSTVITTTL